VLNLSARLLTKFRGLAGLAKAGFGELCQEHGLGEAKAAQLKTALELGRRLMSTQPEERLVVKSPADIANLLQAEMSFLEQEELRLVLLNTKNQVFTNLTFNSSCVIALCTYILEISRDMRNSFESYFVFRFPIA